MKLVNIYTHAIILIALSLGLSPAQAQVWTLSQCIDSAQVHNKSLHMNRNNIAIGQQREKEAKANLLPKLAANADYKYFTNLPNQLLPLSALNPLAPEGEFRAAQFGVPHNINASLQLTMPLYNPQVYGAIQTTEVASELTELQYQKTEEQVIFEISNLYYNAQILYHQMAFIDSNLINAERLRQNVQLLNEQLLAKDTDVSKVRLQVAQLRSQKESVTIKYEQVLNALKFTIGLPLESTVQIENNILYENTLEYLPLPSLTFKIAKIQRHLIAIELKTLNRSKYLPSLSLFANYGTTGFGYNGEPSSFLDFYPIGFAGVQLSYPLFNGTLTQRKINQKKLELVNSELQLAFISDQSNMQIENANLQRIIAKQTVATLTEQIQLAQSIYEQMVLQQEQGTATLTDVLLADNTLREAQQTYLSEVINYLKADLELKKYSGRMSNKN